MKEFAADGMHEFKLPGVKEMSFKPVPFSIERISDNRVAQMLQMHADLMGAPGARHAGDKAVIFVGRDHLVVRHCFTPGGGAASRHFLTLHRMAADGEIDGSLAMTGFPPDDGKVGFLHQTVCKLLGDRGVRLVILGHDDATAGLLVETVDNARTMFFRSGREGDAVVQEGIDESTLLVSCSDMNNHSCWFVDHDQIIILVKDLKRNVLRTGSCGRFGRLFHDDEDIAGLHLIVTANGIPPEGDASRLDECLEFGTRKIGEMSHENHIKPLATILFRGDDFMDGWIGHVML